MIVACEVKVIGAALKAFSKRAPRAASESIAGVRADLYAVRADPIGAQRVDGDEQEIARRRRPRLELVRGLATARGDKTDDEDHRGSHHPSIPALSAMRSARSAVRRIAIRYARNEVSVRRADCGPRIADRGLWRYSFRSATIGSTRAARRAGR